jgi:APA family basic amino acid/polyamine antiporter
MARRRHPGRTPAEAGARGGGLFGLGYAYLGWAAVWSLGLVALYAQGATPLVLLVAGALLGLTCLSYAELASALPTAGGVAGFAARALDQLTGFAAGWALLLDSVILVAVAALFVPHYLAVFWPTLAARPYDGLAAATVLAFLVAFGVAGLRWPGWAAGVPALLTLVLEALLVVIGSVLVLSPPLLVDQVDVGTTPTWNGLLYALPIAAAGFLGIDALLGGPPEASRSRERLPGVLTRALPLAAVVCLLLGLVGLSALPVSSNVVPVDPATGRTVPVAVVPASDGDGYVLASDRSTVVVLPVEKQGSWWVIPSLRPTGPVVEGSAGPSTRLYGTELGGAYVMDPLVGILAGLRDEATWLRDVMRPLVAFLAAAVLLVAAGLSIGGSSRLVYSFARERQLPSPLGRLYATTMTPYLAVILCGTAAAALSLLGGLSLLGELLGFGFSVALVLVNLAVIALRYREPGLARPFCMPWNIRSGSGVVPVAAVAGAAGGALVWIVMVVTHPTGRWVGLAWMAGGILAYVLYRRSAGYPLLRPAAAVDVVYDQILVPVVGTRLTDEMLVLACQLATEKASSIDVLNVLEVPMDLPLDAPLELERRRAEKIVELAIATAGEFGVEARGHVVAARSAGKTIVQIATERKSEVIFLGAPKKRRVQDRIFGETVSYVLRHAPCEVIVNLVPPDYPLVGSADEVMPSLSSLGVEP